MAERFHRSIWQRGIAMVVAKLIAFVVLGQVAGGGTAPDPTALVGELGAARYAERESASKALCELGRLALPALRSARESRDPEIRSRAHSLIQKIEGALLTQSTRVRLDFQDTPLPEVTRSLSQQVGARVVLDPEDLRKWRLQRVTIHEKAPVDFWKAVDRLCDAAGLQCYPNLNAPGAQREPILALGDGAIRTITPNSDHGPFRVSLLGLHDQRDLSYVASEPDPQDQRRARGGPVSRRLPAPAPQLNPVRSAQFTATLQVLGEPRLVLSQSDPFRVQVVEAVDERGNSLILPAGREPHFRRSSAYFGLTQVPVMQLEANLHRPATAGQWIKKLRGFISLTVSSRRPDPLVVPLEGAAGKTFENADIRLTLHEVHTPADTHQTTLEFSVKTGDELNASSDQREFDGFNRVMQRMNAEQLQIELLDGRGRIIPWYQSRVDADSSRVVLTLVGLPAPASPKELRYYTVTRATTNVPFEFTDIPMP